MSGTNCVESTKDEIEKADLREIRMKRVLEIRVMVTQSPGRRGAIGAIVNQFTTLA